MDWLGLLIGIASLVLTSMIYMRQTRAQERFQGFTKGSLEKLTEMTGSGFARFDEAWARSVSEAGAADDDEPVVPRSELLRHGQALGEAIGDGVRRYEHDEIPLRVLADLVTGLRDANGRLTENEGWLAGEARFALHKDTGKGNRPWFVFLQDMGHPERILPFRVSRGGAGRSGPTVTAWDAFENVPA